MQTQKDVMVAVIQSQQTMTAPHANIQDVFNEFGAQMMSPHHQNDPPEKIWVPKEQ